MTASRITITLPPDTLAAIDARGDNRSQTITACLQRYDEALRRARADLRSAFSDAEICLILDALNGTLTEAHTIPITWAAVQDAITLNGLDVHWHVDGPTLVDKLRRLDYIAACALVDAVARWWRRVARGENPERHDLF